MRGNKRKKLGERGFDCIFVGYAHHSHAYRFYVIESNDYISVNWIIESRDAILMKLDFHQLIGLKTYKLVPMFKKLMKINLYLKMFHQMMNM